MFIIPTASFINKLQYEAIYNTPRTKKLLRKVWNDRKTPSVATFVIVLLFQAICKQMMTYSVDETRNPKQRTLVMSQTQKKE